MGPSGQNGLKLCHYNLNRNVDSFVRFVGHTVSKDSYRSSLVSDGDMTAWLG